MSVFELSQNPFRCGAGFRFIDIVGREHEVAHTESIIRDRSRLFLIGARGFGKTSILHAAQMNMTHKGAIVVYVDAESTPDVEKLIEEIVSSAAAQGLNMKVSTPLNPTANKFKQIERLASMFDALDSQAGRQPEDRPVALIIDEFSSLMARFGVSAEGQIRSVVQTHQNIGYIFSGSNVQLMMDMTGKYSRPFYHGGSIYYLQPVLAAEFAAWIHKQFQKGGFEVDGYAPIERILAIAEEVPYNTQLLAHNCWEMLYGQTKSVLTVAVVETVFMQTIQNLDLSFKKSWSRLTPLQRGTLVAVLRGNGVRQTPTEIARAINSPASSVRSALRALYNRLILWDDCRNSGVRVRFEDPFFAHWVRITNPNVECKGYFSATGGHRK